MILLVITSWLLGWLAPSLRPAIVLRSRPGGPGVIAQVAIIRPPAARRAVMRGCRWDREARRLYRLRGPPAATDRTRGLDQIRY